LNETTKLSRRVLSLHEEVRSFAPALCAERALLVTRYFKKEAGGQKPMIVRKAEALSFILANKTVCIYPRELLVGNFTSHRVGGGLYPELHGIAIMEDLFRFDRRPVNPFVVSKEDRSRLLREVVPFWFNRIMAVKGMPWLQRIRFAANQITSKYYLLNEIGGISHFVPDYKGLVERGTSGFREEASERMAKERKGSDAANFLEAIKIVCDGLETFADRYRQEALKLSRGESDPVRREELEEIAEACGRVPRLPARTFREALQSIVFAQIALNLESLDNSVSPGRLDQILFPFYERDIAKGNIDREGAYELLGCFAVKLCEILPIFSMRVSQFHGGLFNGQVMVVGGTDRKGADATNELTYLFIDLMDQLRTRQPNYHARIHRSSPQAYRQRISSALSRGSVSPAIYNDEVIVPLLVSRGISRDDALDYANVGCVEPVASGMSYMSTDAVLLNLPILLELALNRGRQFGRWRRTGAATPPAEECQSMEDLVGLLRIQINFGVSRMLKDARHVEEANAQWHPTPLTSMLLKGCIANGRDASCGGATYNGSGIQGVGIVDVGDSLAAIDWVVFKEGKATISEVVRACKDGFRGHDALHSRLRNAPKYGNGHPLPDEYVGRVMQIFGACLSGKKNFRGGDYAAGFYSVTAHVAFGKVVGALPSGRLAGEPFSSGISPENGMDRKGPTAALGSAAALPLHLALNGSNFNLQLDPWVVAGADGTRRLQGLIDGGFAAGCMQMQVNVLDPKMLIEARDHPGRYPGLLVRVSGYSAYFDDLTPEQKQEIINRMVLNPPCPT